MAQSLEGGCFCGEVRYRITGVAVLQLMCFCRDCLSMTGTDGYAGYMIKSEDLQLLKGKPRTFEKTSKEGRIVIKNFCGTCGSSLCGQTSFGLTSIAAGSLDDPDQFKPTKKVFVKDAPNWARIPHHLEEM
ncbi:GFA family protein [uncultured Ruegeria sp.]|uniref:GFA family protein n=1 Tax=uncultured Ruegeria sp. TaxID=259304 RepID=UPI002608EC42|nr:GFA family protein [uncultured Ruegeria sp.]